jgi:hypothetical protein
MFKKLAVLLSGALVLSLPTLGDQWNKKTLLTFSQPVEIPGVILPAGQYVFKLADSLSDRHIVQVFNADEDKVFATILAIPHYRMTPADKTVILFEERRADQPEAIHAWFYPGEVYGQEFVYPKGRALELARATHQPVLTGEVRPTETPSELENTPVVAVTPENKEVEVAEVIEATPTAPEPSTGPAAPTAPIAVATPAPEQELPKTASPLPTIALLGMGSLAMAWLLKAVRSQNS